MVYLKQYSYGKDGAPATMGNQLACMPADQAVLQPVVTHVVCQHAWQDVALQCYQLSTFAANHRWHLRTILHQKNRWPMFKQPSPSYVCQM
jgi:hypothetical protein